MNIGDRIKIFIERLAPAPHDALYSQAADLVARYDANHDGVVDVRTETNHINEFGLPMHVTTGLNAADTNKTGFVTTREMRALLARYDSGTPGQQNSAANGVLEGVEWLGLLRDFGEQPGYDPRSALVAGAALAH